MKKKFAWILNISTLALCLCALAIGVFAAKQASLTVNGSIGFTAYGVDAEITGSISGTGKINNNVATSGTFPTMTFNTSTPQSGTQGSTTGKLPDWSNDIEFNQDGGTIEITIEVTNKSEKKDLWIYVEDVADPVVNLKRVVTGEQARCVLKGGTNSTSFTISIDVYDTCSNLGANPGYNFKVNLYDESAIKKAEADDVQIEYVRIEETQTAQVNGFKSTATDKTKINIEPLINIGGTVCTVVQTKDADSSNTGAFNGLSVDEITLPQTLKRIGDNTRFGCGSNVVVVIPYSVSYIGINGANCGVVKILGCPELNYISEGGSGDMAVWGDSGIYIYDENFAEYWLAGIGPYDRGIGGLCAYIAGYISEQSINWGGNVLLDNDFWFIGIE